MAFQFDPSGVIKPPTAEELQAADANGEVVVVLDRGTLEDNSPYWAYVAVKPSKYTEFMQLGKTRQPKRIADYGDILRYGFDDDVPDSVRQEMKAEHGYDEAFEDKLGETIKAERMNFLKQKETQRIGDIVAMLKQKQGGS